MTLAIAAPRRAGGQPHPLGHCTCVSHVDRPWNRPEHWTADEVTYLEAQFGRASDEAIARHLGRTVVGIRLKARRLGLRKKDAGLTATSVAQIFGIDATVVSKVWLRRGLLRSRRPYLQGPNRVHLVMEEEVERFIREHGEYVDIDKMAESPYRDLALAGGRWHSLPDVQRITGRNAHVLSGELSRGRWPARKRGAHWMIHESQLEAISATAGHNGRAASWTARERTLEHRRNVRKGVEQPRPHTLRGRKRSTPIFWRVVPCEPCAGNGRFLAKVARVARPTVQQRVVAYAVRQAGSVDRAAQLLKRAPREVSRLLEAHNARLATLRRRWRPCEACGGKGRVLQNRHELRQLPKGWAA